MVCSKCRTKFCFRCGLKLKADDPYVHFSDRLGSCYNRLFDYTPEEEQRANWNAIAGAMFG